jgi:hypothetical protein
MGNTLCAFWYRSNNYVTLSIADKAVNGQLTTFTVNIFQHTVNVPNKQNQLELFRKESPMNRSKWQCWLTGSDSPLLQLGAILVLLQLVLWATAKPASEVTARDTTASTVYKDSSASFQSRSQYRQTRDFAGEQNRYYDPDLAMVAESLDAASRCFVAMALEDCYALSQHGLPRFRDDFLHRVKVGAGVSDQYESWLRERAFAGTTRHCLVFDGAPISPEKILGLLQSSARDGDPRAIARTLLFRDLADSKQGTFDLVTRLLSTRDPLVIRDVGLFLTRGESSMIVGNGSAPVNATSLAIAWELVACDFGMDCGSDSKLLNNLCAYQGQCRAFSYEDWLGRYTESAEELREIKRLRALLHRGLVTRDWGLLGLSVLDAT